MAVPGREMIRSDLIWHFKYWEKILKSLPQFGIRKLTRQEEVAYLQHYGINLSWEKAQYSINQGLWGTSVGGKETLTSQLPLPEDAFPHPLETGIEPRTLTLSFKKGELRAIDDQNYKPLAAIEELTKIARDYAIGRDMHVGDTIIGIKGRVGFEAGAPPNYHQSSSSFGKTHFDQMATVLERTIGKLVWHVAS